MEKSVLRPRTVDALCTLKLVFEPIRNRWGWGLDDWLITGEGTGRILGLGTAWQTAGRYISEDGGIQTRGPCRIKLVNQELPVTWCGNSSPKRYSEYSLLYHHHSLDSWLTSLKDFEGL
jgi:hypothetical protein